MTWNENGKENIEGNDVLICSSALESNLTELESNNFEFWENLGEFLVLCPTRSAVFLHAAPKRRAVHLCTAPAFKARHSVSMRNASNFWPISLRERGFSLFWASELGDEE